MGNNFSVILNDGSGFVFRETSSITFTDERAEDILSLGLARDLQLLPSTMKTWSAWSVTHFWWFWGVSALVGASVLWAFASLCFRGVVSSANILPWCAILLVLAGVIGGSLWLRSTGREGLAALPLLLLVVPVVVTLVGTLAFSAFYFLVFIFGSGRMN